MSLTATDKNINAHVIKLLREKSQAHPSAIRQEAFEFFEKAGLPATKHEEYKHTPITRELENNFSFADPIVLKKDTDISEFLIPGLDANLIVFVNGIFSKSSSKISSPDSEIRITDLHSAVASDTVAREHFAKYNPGKSDAFAAWNAAGWNDGVFIHVPDNTALSKPLLLQYINDATAGEIIAVNRNLIVVGKSSELTFIEKYDSTGDANHFLNAVTEVVVGENAGMNIYSIQNDTGNRYLFAHTEIYQRNSSRVNTYTFTLSGKVIRNNLHLVLDGEGIESHMYGLYLLGGTTLADNHTVVDHRKPNSFSNEMYKGVMDGSSRGVFNGKIYVRPNAQKTNAFQANRNILLTDKAAVNTKPQLEIWADDVKCSHGCTSGQLDEEAVFYLRSRGIQSETARAMMLYAFAGEVVEQVRHPALRSYLDDIISERLHKNF